MSRRSRACPRTPRAGVRAGWPRPAGFRPRQSSVSGGPSAGSHAGRKRSSSPPIRDLVGHGTTNPVVGLCESPPDRAIVLCVTSDRQSGSSTDDDRPMPTVAQQPGHPARRSHDYKRHGTTSLFAALDIATGDVIGKCYGRRRAREFRDFLDEIEMNLPGDLDVHRCGQLRPQQGPATATGSPRRDGTCDFAPPRILAQSGRALHRRSSQSAGSGRYSGSVVGPASPHHRIRRPPQCGDKALPLDQISRRHPGFHRALLPIQHARAIMLGRTSGSGTSLAQQGSG